MRSITATLYQNPGDGTYGSSCELTNHLVDVAGFKREVDKELTKLTPGEVSLRVEDHNSAIWDWIQASIHGTGILYPPHLRVAVGGVLRFAGTVDPTGISRDYAKREITLTGQDWSLELEDKRLGAPDPDDDADPTKNPWARPHPLATASRPASAGHTGTIGTFLVGWHPRDIIVFPTPLNWCQVGDLLDGSTTARTYTGLKILTMGDRFPLYTVPAGYVGVQVNQQVWYSGEPETGTFDRRVNGYTATEYYTITATVVQNTAAPCYTLTLDTVAGLVPGDVLQLVYSDKSAHWTVLQVSPATKTVTTREEVADVAAGDRIFFTDDSLAELVMDDARSAIARAASPRSVDWTRYTPPTLSVPVIVTLPMRPFAGADLNSVSDLDTTATELRVYGSATEVWEGSPELGWDPAASADRLAPWTDQALAPPAAAMPVNSDAWFRWDARWPAFAVHLDSWVYDYAAMRELHIDVEAHTLTRRTWTYSGGAWNWGAETVTSWVGHGTASVSVWPGYPDILLAMGPTGIKAVTVASGATSDVLALPTGVSYLEAVLRPTPWGAYLLTKRGYGRLSWVDADTLALAWVEVLPAGCEFYPGTFHAVDVDTLFAFAKFQVQDSEGKTLVETHAILLDADPVTTDAPASVLWDEKILEGAAVSIGAVRDPVLDDRVIAHAGGQLYSVSKTLSPAYCLERYKPGEMKAGELIEHICQLLVAVAVPDVDGVLQIVSRASTGSPAAVTVDQVEIQTTRLWENWFSTVQVSGTTDDATAEATGTTAGGQVLEISNHPLLYGRSSCVATAQGLVAWFGVPRRAQRETWFHSDPSTAAPWEALEPLDRIQINGDSTVWMVVSIDDRGHSRDGKATVELVEVPA